MSRCCDPLINRRRVLLAITTLTSVIWSASNISLSLLMAALARKLIMSQGKNSCPLGLLKTPLICAAIMRPTSRQMPHIIHYATITRSLETILSCVVGMSRFLTKYTHRLASGKRLLVSKVRMPVGDTSHFDPGLAMTRTASCMISDRVDSMRLLPSTSGSSLNLNMALISFELNETSLPSTTTTSSSSSMRLL